MHNENNKTYYYSFKYFIPADLEFIDRDPDPTICDYPIGYGPYHHINQMANGGKQMQTDTDSENRLLLGLTYVHDVNATNNDRDLSVVLYDASSNNNCRLRRIAIPNGIKKGKWNEIVL